MVNGVLVSCYANTHHDVAHLAMTPMHRFSAVIKLIFGDDTGYPVFVTTIREVVTLLLPNEYFWNI